MSETLIADGNCYSSCHDRDNSKRHELELSVMHWLIPATELIMGYHIDLDMLASLGIIEYMFIGYALECYIHKFYWFE